MKKLMIMCLLMISIVLMGTTWTVGPDTGQDYSTITAAYNAASDGDTIVIYPDTYDESIGIYKDLIIKGSSNDPTEVIIDNSNLSYAAFHIHSNVTCTIENLTVQNSTSTGSGISIFQATVNINNCIVQNCDYGIGSYYSTVDIDNCIIRDNTLYGIYLDEPLNRTISTVRNSLIYYNGYDHNSTSGGGIRKGGGEIANCTVVNNRRGITRMAEANIPPSLENCIVRNNSMVQLQSAITDVTYSNIHGGIAGIGNIDSDPLFVDYTNNDFSLEVESPCIDTGNPESELDIDGTLADMGSLYFPHPDFDIKKLHDDFNWISYPRLTQQGTYNGELWEQAYYSHARPGLFEETEDVITIDGFYELSAFRNNLNPYLIYYNGNWVNNQFINKLYRYEGYKLDIFDDTPDQIQIIDGTQITSYEWDLNAYGTYWLGYYPVRPQNIVDAFGSAFASVERVWAEDWYYDKQSIIRGVGSGISPANSTKGKSLEYGKMYIVEMKTSYQDFSWNISGQTQIPIVKSTPTNYDFTTQASYEAIDMLNIPAGITEIGVFEAGVCIGATVVQGSNEQVLAYSNSVNRDLADLNFEFYTGRGNEEICKYSVLNPQNGKFEERPLQLRANSYNVISFDRAEQAEESQLPQLSATNYPNPFNPTTEISFSIPTEGDVKVEVYNIKGQKVKTLADSRMGQGTHAVIWNGNDSNNKSVSSGIYFYKLTAGKEVVTKRMMLIK